MEIEQAGCGHSHCAFVATGRTKQSRKSSYDSHEANLSRHTKHFRKFGDSCSRCLALVAAGSWKVEDRAGDAGDGIDTFEAKVSVDKDRCAHDGCDYVSSGKSRENRSICYASHERNVARHVTHFIEKGTTCARCQELVASGQWSVDRMHSTKPVIVPVRRALDPVVAAAKAAANAALTTVKKTRRQVEVRRDAKRQRVALADRGDLALSRSLAADARKASGSLSQYPSARAERLLQSGQVSEIRAGLTRAIDDPSLVHMWPAVVDAARSLSAMLGLLPQPQSLVPLPADPWARHVALELAACTGDADTVAEVTVLLSAAMQLLLAAARSTTYRGDVVVCASLLDLLCVLLPLPPSPVTVAAAAVTAEVMAEAAWPALECGAGHLGRLAVSLLASSTDVGVLIPLMEGLHMQLQRHESAAADAIGPECWPRLVAMLTLPLDATLQGAVLRLLGDYALFGIAATAQLARVHGLVPALFRFIVEGAKAPSSGPASQLPAAAGFALLLLAEVRSLHGAFAQFEHALAALCTVPASPLFDFAVSLQSELAAA